LASHIVGRYTDAAVDIRVPEYQGTGQDESVEKWYALRVTSNFEKATAQALRGRGLEDFLPLYCRVQETPTGGSRKVEVPLFPGYVFGRFDISHRLPVLTIPGVLHIVGFGRTPAPVDTEELTAIRRVLGSGLHVEPWPFLKVSERVSIERGPLRGLEGVVLRLKGTCRLIVSVTLLQRSIAAEIDRESVRPLPSRIHPARTGITLAAAAG
jgi:transcription antitermination factor NusG